MTTWASRIDDLQKSGLTQAEIAEQIGVAPSTVGDLKSKRSASPRGEAALKLDALHRLRCAGSDADATV
jgi:transcriptional regulator with XRE-family HTH domain